jgi:hypothetical protein
MRNFYTARHAVNEWRRDWGRPDDRSSSSQSEAHEDVLIGTRGSGCRFRVTTVSDTQIRAEMSCLFDRSPTHARRHEAKLCQTLNLPRSVTAIFSGWVVACGELRIAPGVAMAVVMKSLC